VGAVYAANTFGSIAGSILTGFLLIPSLGALKSILAAAALNLAIGLAGLLFAEVPRRARLAACAIVAAGAAGVAFFALPSWQAQRMSLGFSRLIRAYRFAGYERGIKVAHDLIATSGTAEGTEQLKFYREGRLASVAVIASPGRTALIVNGKPDATTGQGEDMMTQVMLGQIPLMLAPRAQDVCIIGYGSGVTTHAVLSHPVREALTVEIEPAVIEAAPWFRDGAFEPLKDPRSRLVIEDAGTFLRSTRQTFDVIISEPSNPWIAGVGDLFTQEFYEQAAGRLRPGGVFCQWLQCYEISPQTMWTIFRTLAARFPGGQIFFFRPSNDLVIVGAKDKELVLDPAVLAFTFARAPVREDLARIGITSVPDMLRYYRGRLDRIALLGGEGPVNTDDNGWLEHRAPLDLVLPAQRGDPLSWSADVASDLVASLGPDKEAAAALVVAAVRNAISAGDRASARGFNVALEKMGRPEAQEFWPQLKALDTKLENAKHARDILDQAAPLLQSATQEGNAELGARVAAMLEDAERLDPDSGEIAWRRGTALIAARRPEDAIRELRRALGLLPQSKHLLVRRDLVVASFFRRDFPECLLELDEMERLKPGSAEARYWRARLLIEQGQRAAAAEEIRKGLADYPDNKRLQELAKQLP
jgi:tetratricopeptide (TPR) repeat protein